MSEKITMKVTQAWLELQDEKERDAVKQAKALIKKIESKIQEFII